MAHDPHVVRARQARSRQRRQIAQQLGFASFEHYLSRRSVEEGKALQAIKHELGMSPSTVRRAIQAGHLPAVRSFGGHYYVLRSDVEESRSQLTPGSHA